MIVECFIRLAKGFKTGFHYWPHVPVQNRLLLQALAPLHKLRTLLNDLCDLDDVISGPNVPDELCHGVHRLGFLLQRLSVLAAAFVQLLQRRDAAAEVHHLVGDGLSTFKKF